MKKSYRAIGVMSGTSLDGLDIALCSFTRSSRWQFKILDAVTIPYSTTWKERLTTAPFLSGEALVALHTEYGSYIGECVNAFRKRKKISAVDLLASHGHTVFHQTNKKFTFQLGEGNAVHAATGQLVVCDFRSLDVALKGQGAPLVPIGDRLLFGNYDVCLNLGGIGNISLEEKGKRVAYDVCFANMGLNYLASKKSLELDFNGRIASLGSVDQQLLVKLRMAYKAYHKKRPALGREGFEETFQSLLDDESKALADRMRTWCEAIVEQIGASLPRRRKKTRLLVTGGGAHNSFLIRQLRQQLADKVEMIIPDDAIIDFKEAMVFAFLGVLRLRGEPNVLRSVTRASRDSCSGVVIGRSGSKVK